MKYQAIVLAAGNSSRSNLNYNKNLYKIDNQPIIHYSTMNFLNDKDCSKVIIVCKENELSTISSIFNNENKIVFALGGNTRQESVKNGLSLVDEKYVLVHDGARPHFSNDLLEKLKEKVVEHNSVIPVISINDTIKVIKDNKVVKTLNRDEIKRVQTPQAFDTYILKKAHDLASNNMYSDDSAMLEEILQISTYVVDGEVKNIKYTNPEDF